MKFITAQTRSALAEILATRVAEDLRAAISRSGQAFIAVPGGSTPASFLDDLGRRDLAWEKVVLTLTDERWVPATSERSNHGLLKRTLLSGIARAAAFVPLYCDDGREPDTGLTSVTEALASAPWPLDVAVLGMGEDMHTASMFPGADRLAAALDPEGEDRVIALHAPGAPEPRISLTLPALASAAEVCLLIHGTAKRDALQRAMTEAPEAAPIRAVIEAAQNVTVYYAD